MMDTQLSGLSASEAAVRLTRDGANVLEAPGASTMARLRKLFLGPIPLMLIAAAALSEVAGKRGDALIILALFAINVGIQVWHERKADSATRQLSDTLATRVRVKRDGAWQEVASSALVSGDIIELAVGALLPADVRMRELNNLSLNESTVTGESLPREKQVGDIGYAGSFVATGTAIAEVVATGAHTYFGDALRAASSVRKRSALERDILIIARYLSFFSVFAIIVISIALYLGHAPVLDIATLDLSLLIAGIPVALPTVMSLIISVGVLNVAKKHAIVRRLSSLEDLANVSLLLTDKTGTLTENVLHVRAIETFGSATETDVLRFAFACAENDGHNAIDRAIEERAKDRVTALPLIAFIPGDSERKRSTATVADNGAHRVVSLGAPQVIRHLCDLSTDETMRYEQLLTASAARGERVLALAVGDAEAHMQLFGLISLSDRLRADVPDVLRFLREHGIAVKMLTGDTFEIASDVAKSLGFTGSLLRREVVDDTKQLASVFASAAGFAEMLPKDKLTVVLEAAKQHTVAVTGDGVNDVPAVKAADVGIAVKNAVDALRGTADIVLLSDGLGVIKDAIIEARQIFARLYHYSVFRIAESFRVIVTIAIIGLILGAYPLSPVQLILLALLNDIPVVSIAFDRVRIARAPAAINVRRRFLLSTILGITGVGNSLLMLALATAVWHLPWELIQTVFFLKLVVSGHLMIYLAHTDERWWRFLPSRSVILATLSTQLLATLFAVVGIFAAAISWQLALFVWLWAFVWMQVGEFAKYATQKFGQRQ